MRGITAITQEYESSLWKPVNEYRHQLSSQLRWSLVATTFGQAQFLGPIQGGQHRQSPSPPGKRELYRDSQYDPTMPPAKDHMTISGIYGIVMTALAIDMLTPVLSRRVVHRDQNRFIRWDIMQNRTSQDFAERPQRPGCAGEDPMIRRWRTWMTCDQASHCLWYRGDGSSAHCDDGSDGQRKDSLESWLGKCYRKTHEKVFCCRWHRKHNGLLSDVITVVSNKVGRSLSNASLFVLRIINVKNGKSRAKCRLTSRARSAAARGKTRPFAGG